MRGKIPISKYLIVSIIILTVGLPTAYAITITLGGDPVIINGILDLMGNRITNVGTPTVSTDAATKAYVDSAPSTDTLALLGCTDTQIAQFVGSAWTCVADPAIATDVNCVGCVSTIDLAADSVTGEKIEDSSITASDLGASGCAGNEVLKWNSGTSLWECAVDIDTDTTFSGADFAVSNQACPGGQKATGVDASGSVTCAVDIDTTFDGTDFALSGQSCPAGEKATGVDASGSVICAVDIDTDTVPWNSRVPQSTSLTPVDFTVDVGEHTSITIGTDGLPVISYRDGTSFNLKVAHCGNASCSSGNTLTTVDNAALVGTDTSIAIGTDGFPVISYRDNTGGNLKVAHCENILCNSGSPTLTTVDNAADVGVDSSITIGTDGLPVISYYDFTNTALKVAHCTNTSCSNKLCYLTTRTSK